MTPLEQLARFVAARAEPPFDWVVEHCPHGTLDDVWRASARHVDNLARLEILHYLGPTRKSRARLQKAVLALVAADGAKVESTWETEDGKQTFRTHYAETATRVVLLLARHFRRGRVHGDYIDQLYEQLRGAAINEACVERGAYNAFYQQTRSRSGRCYLGDCEQHAAHLDVADDAARFLAGFSVGPARLLMEVGKTLSNVAIRNAIVAAVPTLPLDEVLRGS